MPYSTCTDFGNDYNPFETPPTVGAFAVLIASPDVTDRETANFLQLVNNAGKRNQSVGRIFNNPPIRIEDIQDSYRARYAQKRWSIGKSSLVFLLTITISTVATASFFVWLLSLLKQTVYYRDMMNIYRDTLQTTDSEELASTGPPEHQIQMNHAHALVIGMRKLLKIGARAREDYNTGGMTIPHHQFLLDNLTHVFEWFQEKLAQRLSYIVELLADRNQTTRQELRTEIGRWHAEGYLRIDAYKLLLERLKD